MDGLIIVDKPAGWTSHDVVLKLRKTLRLKRIGHGGTLDPLATGVLLVTVGQATRLFPYLAGMDKTYSGEIRLGLATDTYDSQGKPLGPEKTFFPKEKELAAVVASFVGEISQLPPPYSAKKINGQPAFKLARRGLQLELQPVNIVIHRFLVLDYAPPLVKFLVECSSGTYIRSLAHDLGQKLDCGAHLTALRRLAVGRYTEEEALTPGKIEELVREKAFDRFLLPLEKLLPDYPAVWVDPEGARAFKNGARIGLGQVTRVVLAGSRHTENIPFRVFSEQGRLLGLARFEARDKFFQPELVLGSGQTD
ncbi:MAG: tRNA pseudouridine(55) synthase TruB [Candidatus Saccharicenans sp.]|jgi:tRNA pseudouridine55 synthase|nr:tRNA pseudouridine(55) synthase TruB [Candidatus Saccharicenans sp.]MDH7494015.1 tRNA pseudouridine(55) synthase TruB [Candidatus Saccharicenans sp.]